MPGAAADMAEERLNGSPDWSLGISVQDRWQQPGQTQRTAQNRTGWHKEAIDKVLTCVPSVRVQCAGRKACCFTDCSQTTAQSHVLLGSSGP